MAQKQREKEKELQMQEKKELDEREKEMFKERCLERKERCKKGRNLNCSFSCVIQGTTCVQTCFGVTLLPDQAVKCLSNQHVVKLRCFSFRMAKHYCIKHLACFAIHSFEGGV